MHEQILALITAVITFLGYLAQKQLKVNNAPQQLAVGVELARTVVGAAEKVGNTLGLNGGDKYDYAEKALITAAKRVGMNLKPEEANALIHSVLHEVDVLSEPVQQLPDLAA